MTSALRPLCFGASGSVRTKVKMMSASWAPDVHTFWPLTTNSSPSSTARVRSPARSLPAFGSLIPSAAVISARRIGTAQRCFCSGVPNIRIDGAMIPRPCGLKLWYTRRRISSSSITNCSSSGALRPPNSGGWPGSSQPASNIAAWNARAHGGTSADDFARGNVVSAGGRCSSSQAENSARTASTSGGNVSFMTPVPPSRCGDDVRRHCRT